MLGTLDLLVGVASAAQLLEILEISAHAVLQLLELVHLGLCRSAAFDLLFEPTNASIDIFHCLAECVAQPLLGEVLAGQLDIGLGRGLVEPLWLLLRRLLDRQRLLLLLEIGQLSSLHRGHWTLEELSWVVTCLHEWKRLVVVHGRLHLLHLLRRQINTLLQIAICWQICVFPIVRRGRRSGWLLLGEDGEVVGLHVMGHIPADSNDLH
jgi:hypothetical protein